MRGFSVILVLPLLLTRLTTPEIALWYLFSSVIGLQGVVDMGFAPTFSRVISYAMGGVRDLGSVGKLIERQSNGPNWGLIQRIWQTMWNIYARLSLVAVLGMGTLGTIAVWKPITELPNPRTGWTAWIIIVCVSGSAFLGSTFSAYLQGVNEIARLRRWEAISLLGAIVTSFAVLLCGGGLVALVIANQAWTLVGILRNWQLSRQVAAGTPVEFKPGPTDIAIFDVVWPAAWRSGVGGAFARGMTLASGLIYAQIASAAQLASYLLAFRVIQIINDFSQAPFYSKLPSLTRLRAEGSLTAQLSLAKRGMRLAYWSYLIPFIAVGLGATPALRSIGSRADFVSPDLWSLLGLAFLLERYGAMHLQLYSTTNHIIWHIANGVAGSLYLAVSVAALPHIGVYAFPVAFIVGNGGFYAWYCASHSYRAFGIGLRFELSSLIPPLILMLIYAGFTALGFAG